MPEDVLKNHFRDAVLGVDMDPIYPYEAYSAAYLKEQQAELVKRRKIAESQSGCVCAELEVIVPYESKFST